MAVLGLAALLQSSQELLYESWYKFISGLSISWGRDMPLDGKVPTLPLLLRSTLFLIEYYENVEFRSEPIMDELKDCMRRAIAQLNVDQVNVIADQSKAHSPSRPVAAENLSFESSEEFG